MGDSDEIVVVYESGNNPGSLQRNMQLGGKVNVKWKHVNGKGEVTTRIFPLPRATGYSGMMREIRRFLPNFSGNPYWIDEDGDKITVFNDGEFSHAASLTSNKKTFHLFTTDFKPDFCICKSNNYIWNESKSTVLGGGKYGKTITVVKGHEKRSGEFVAIKVFRDPKKAQNQCAQEWALGQELRNDFIVHYLAKEMFVNAEDGIMYPMLVMELADGTVRDELNKPKHCFGLPYQVLFTIIDNCVTALEYLNGYKGKGIAHRNINPDHVLIFKKPRLKCKLCGFGDAHKLEKPDEKMHGKAYVSPYDASGIVSDHAVRSVRGYTKDEQDLWSSACSFFECATGRQPFLTETERGVYIYVSYQNLNDLLKPRKKGVVYGERKLKPNGQEFYNDYHFEMPLQHYSYSRSLKCILTQFFQRLFAPGVENPFNKKMEKEFLQFGRFCDLCRVLTKLKGYKYYNVSELCVDEYFNTMKSQQFTQRSLYDDVLGAAPSQSADVKMMKGMEIISDNDKRSFQPEGNFNKLVVWKSIGTAMVTSMPEFQGLMEPISETMDVREVAGMIIQMQMQEQQIRIFHDAILEFCRTGEERLRVKFNEQCNAQQMLPDTTGQFSTADNGDDFEDLLNVMEGLPTANLQDEEIQAAINERRITIDDIISPQSETSTPSHTSKIGGDYEEGLSSQGGLATGGSTRVEAMDVGEASSSTIPMRSRALSEQKKISDFQQITLRIRAIANAQEEMRGIPLRNELFQANCNLIAKQYTDAKESLRATRQLVYDNVTKVFEKELVNLYTTLDLLRPQPEQPNAYQWR